MQMILRAMTSLWHWHQREDCSRQNLSVGYWQVSRVLSSAGYGEMSLDVAKRCLEVSESEEPFYRGYAHEAMARAAKLMGDQATSGENLRMAKVLAEQVTDEEERSMLEKDLEELEG